MEFTLKHIVTGTELRTENPISVASTLRIPLTMILRVGESIERNDWRATRIK